MAKAIVCVGTTQTDFGIVYINYSVSILDTVPYSYNSSYLVDTEISVTADLTAWKNKIITEALQKKNTVLVLTDIIVFGAPT